MAIKREGITIIGILLVIIVFGVFIFLRVTERNQETEDGLSEKEIEGIVENVSRLILVPENEDPSVTIVSLADELREEQLFYRDVQNGDVIIIYQSIQRAIIYRPETNILINVGPIYIEPDIVNDLEMGNVKAE